VVEARVSQFRHHRWAGVGYQGGSLLHHPRRRIASVLVELRFMPAS
jgi:hypothetical protein